MDYQEQIAARNALIAAHVPGEHTIAELDRLISTVWSLRDYLLWLGRRDQMQRLSGWWVGSLTLDLDHWAQSGVTTALDLACYLDGCVAKEQRRSSQSR